MRAALLGFVLLVCRSWDYVKGTGCPPGVPCWSWYPNSQPGHMPQHQPFGHPLVVQNWPPLTAASAQHSHAAMAPLATPSRLYYDQGIASVPTYQTQPNRPLSGEPGIYPESYQSAVGSSPYKNFNPTRVNPSATQVFPPGRQANAPPAPTTQSPIANYLCEIVKRDRNQGMHPTPSPVPQQSSASHHAIKTPIRRPVKAPPSPRFTTTRPPAKQPHPSISPRPATPPNNRTANGISPSLAACEQYRKAAVSFLDNQVRINGGELAGKGEFPYMVAIGYVRGETLFWACGGSLISERYVLTAAHCTQSSQAMALRAGQQRLGARPSAGDFGAEAVLPHPAYSFPEMYHDVALVRTARAVPFSAAVRPNPPSKET
ncbi:Serine protease Hayan [Gryllus bimaculatus]|nr:Serine protease Hayan [Gryllus bimaculatus]